MTDRVDFDESKHIWCDCADRSQHVILKNIHIDHLLHTICGNSIHPKFVYASRKYSICNICVEHLTKVNDTNE